MILYPKQYRPNVYAINYQELYDQGYRGILFDIDNTLVPFDVAEPSGQNIQLFRRLAAMGFKIALISNNNRERVEEYVRRIRVTAFPNGLKPLPIYFTKCRKQMNLEKHKMIFVGDQIFTDVLGGNLAGYYTILVQPIQQKEQRITRVKRGIERLVINCYLKKGKIFGR